MALLSQEGGLRSSGVTGFLQKRSPCLTTPSAPVKCSVEDRKKCGPLLYEGINIHDESRMSEWPS